MLRNAICNAMKQAIIWPRRRLTLIPNPGMYLDHTFVMCLVPFEGLRNPREVAWRRHGLAVDNNEHVSDQSMGHLPETCGPRINYFPRGQGQLGQSWRMREWPAAGRRRLGSDMVYGGRGSSEMSAVTIADRPEHGRYVFA